MKVQETIDLCFNSKDGAIDSVSVKPETRADLIVSIPKMVRLIGFSQNLNILTSGVSIPEMVRLIEGWLTARELQKSFNSRDGAIDS